MPGLDGGVRGRWRPASRHAGPAWRCWLSGARGQGEGLDPERFWSALGSPGCPPPARGPQGAGHRAFQTPVSDPQPPAEVPGPGRRSPDGPRVCVSGQRLRGCGTRGFRRGLLHSQLLMWRRRPGLRPCLRPCPWPLGGRRRRGQGSSEGHVCFHRQRKGGRGRDSGQGHPAVSPGVADLQRLLCAWGVWTSCGWPRPAAEPPQLPRPRTPSVGSGAAHRHTALPTLGSPPVRPETSEGSAGTRSRSKWPRGTFSPFPGTRVWFLERAAARPLDALALSSLRLKVMTCRESSIGSATRHSPPMIYTHFPGGHPSSGSRGRGLFARAGATWAAQLLRTARRPAEQGPREPGPRLLASAGPGPSPSPHGPGPPEPSLRPGVSSRWGLDQRVRHPTLHPLLAGKGQLWGAVRGPPAPTPAAPRPGAWPSAPCPDPTGPVALLTAVQGWGGQQGHRATPACLPPGTQPGDPRRRPWGDPGGPLAGVRGRTYAQGLLVAVASEGPLGLWFRDVALR